MESIIKTYLILTEYTYLCDKISSYLDCSDIRSDGITYTVNKLKNFTILESTTKFIQLCATCKGG